MAETRIPVDVFNPGQVFACLGLLEAADILLGDAEGAFDWREPAHTVFILRADGSDDPLHAVIDFLLNARVESLAPDDSANRTEKWSVPTRRLSTGAPFPAPNPASPATLPACLFTRSHTIVLDYWIDGVGVTGRDNAKFWAGAGGYPGVGLLRDALLLIQAEPQRVKGELFDFAVPQSSSFRLDWRRDYIPLDTGFSLNEHGHIITVGFPLVEVLAAIGLTHARPEPMHDDKGRRDKLNYRYAIPGLSRSPNEAGTERDVLLPPMFLRAALGCANLPFPMRWFHIHLDWPGQENQARAITHVTEETPS